MRMEVMGWRMEEVMRMEVRVMRMEEVMRMEVMSDGGDGGGDEDGGW